MTDKEKLNSIIQKFRDSNKKNPSEDFTYEEISKVGFEKYIGNDRGTIRIFFYTTGSTSNNKPYMLEGRTFDDYIQFEKMLEACRNDVEDLFSVTETDANTDDPFDKKDSTSDVLSSPWAKK